MKRVRGGGGGDKLCYGIYHPVYTERMRHFVSRHTPPTDQPLLDAGQLIEARSAGGRAATVTVVGILIAGDTVRVSLGPDGAPHAPCAQCDVVRNLADDLFGAQCRPTYACSRVQSVRWQLLVGDTLVNLDVGVAGSRFEPMAVHGLPLYARLRLGKTYQLVGWTLRRQDNTVPAAFTLPFDIQVDTENRTLAGLPLIDAGSWPRRSYRRSEHPDPWVDAERGFLFTRGDTLRLALRQNPRLGESGLEVLRLVATLWRHLGPHLPDAAPLEQPDRDELAVPDTVWLFVAYNSGDSARNRVVRTPTGQVLVYTNRSLRLLALEPELRFEVLSDDGNFHEGTLK